MQAGYALPRKKIEIMKPESANKTNWLLRNLIIVSIGIHMVLFMYISGLYDCKAVSYIEMSVKNFTKPLKRVIPRARIRNNISDQPMDVKKIFIKKQIIPRVDIKKMDKIESHLPYSNIESISLPDLLEVPGLKISQWQPMPRVEKSEYMTIKEYYEMIRLKIQSNKKYPENAKTGKVQGIATVRFQLFPSGKAKTIKITTSSKSKILDKAALNAVKSSSPFPKPPSTLISKPIYLEIAINFELI